MGLSRLSTAERQVQRVFDFEHARYRDSLRVHFRPELADELCADVRLPREWFRGKRVLDAGCGSGRWSYALALMGARVMAIDLTASGVRTTQAALAPFEGCHALQGSIFDLPFRPETFDFVMSWGVLHHTPDTHAAFERLVPLVGPGGTLYVMLYERTAWRHRALTDAARAVLRRLPDEARYRACRALVIRDPAWYRRISPWLKVCDGSAAETAAEISTLAFDNFDAYSPEFNHVHTQTEVRRWFHEAEFSDVVLTHPVRFTTPDAVARWGECGGAVHVRGVSTRETARSTAAPFDASGPAPTAPPLDAPLDGRLAGEMAKADEALPPFTKRIDDAWHGVAVSAPAAWEVRREGRQVTIAPPVAQPPFVLAVTAGPRNDEPLEAAADRAFSRWLPADQRATLEHERRRDVGDVLALERRYRLSLGNVEALARFVFLEHAGSLVQLSAVSAWDAAPGALEATDRAFETFVERASLSEPRRDPAAALAYGAGQLARALAAAGRLARRQG